MDDQKAFGCCGVSAREREWKQGNHRSSKGNKSPVNISSKQSPSQASQADKRGKRLDDSWEYAKPLDESRQKMECKYCGFVSVRGGISRLKAHLGGGNPRIPGCDKVSLEIKKVMLDWYNGSMGEKLKSRMGKGNSRGSYCGCGISLLLTFTRFQKILPPQADKRGKRLDDSWEHGIPLDELRHKIKCKYCGFVSIRGGISRLKAHLGGGNPTTPGCDKVSPDVKKVMADWYSGWVKNSKAGWAKEIQAPAKPFKRGRPLDEAWEHTLQLDEIRQGVKCRYCDFVSKRGGIARLKAHLSGGDPTMSIKGCPNVLPNVKDSMSKGMSKNMKIAEGRKMETSREELQEVDIANEAQLTSKRLRVLEEIVDRVKSTSRKANLQKPIDKKHAELLKMQYEIQSLESQLSSVP